jgi:hypothetical protein
MKEFKENYTYNDSYSYQSLQPLRERERERERE